MNVNVQFKGIAAYLPQRIVTNADLEKAGYDLTMTDVFFKGVQQRHWANQKETSVYMGSQAAMRLLNEQDVDPNEIDLIICSAIIGDTLLPHPACGIQHELGAGRTTAITLDTGCASFVSGLIYGSALIRSGMFRNILLISIANFAGRAQSKLRNPSAVIPGDGAGALLICAGNEGENGLLGWWEKSLGEYHQMLSIRAMDEAGAPTQLWDPHQQIAFWFDRQLIETIKTNGRELVPQAIKGALESAELTIGDIDLCFTHQPNDFLIDHWRNALGLREDQHHTTLATCGNLFQASIPVSMVSAINAGKLKRGDVIAMGSFALAGELAAGAVIRMV